jgi:multidrug resistance efflux pump
VIIASDLAEQKSQNLKIRRDAERLLISQIQASLKSLNSFVDEWDLTFSLVSPMSGRISYFTNLVNNEFVNADQRLMAIIPEDERYLAIVHIDQQGYGKIMLGQRVMIKVNNYPFQEFGQLYGSVQTISKVAGERGYVLKVSLTQGLLSTYNKEITYQPNMTGTAEIVTEDLRLIERIFNSIRKIFDR